MKTSKTPKKEHVTKSGGSPKKRKTTSSKPRNTTSKKKTSKNEVKSSVQDEIANVSKKATDGGNQNIGLSMVRAMSNAMTNYFSKMSH